jgi:hypothetical protein
MREETGGEGSLRRGKADGASTEGRKAVILADTGSSGSCVYFWSCCTHLPGRRDGRLHQPGHSVLGHRLGDAETAEALNACREKEEHQKTLSN